MNKLLDLVNSWSYKLTYRILKMSGASDEALENYKKAIEEQKEDILEADKEFSKKLLTANVIKWALIVVAGIIALKILDKNIKFRSYSPGL